MNSTMIFRQNQQINRRVLMFCFLFLDKVVPAYFNRKRRGRPDRSSAMPRWTAEPGAQSKNQEGML
jgi:hypothetical protein